MPSIPAREYDILIGTDLDEQITGFLGKQKHISNFVIITDDIVRKLYGNELQEKLKKAGLSTDIFSFPAGEEGKLPSTVLNLQNQMLEKKLNRDTMVLALGGGVVGDIAGFVAATYMRGISFVQIPTTLLAMADSSVGGKTGVDTEQGKNLIGAFLQPEAVFADLRVLKTLSSEHIVNGSVEILKMFLTHDREMVLFLEKNLDKILNLDLEILEKLLSSSVKIKSEVVQRDEKESNERQVLNFGHTVGHAVEKLSNYQMLHGYAVGLGILVESKIAELVGKLSESKYLEIEKLITSLGIEKKDLREFKTDKILEEVLLDKKTKDGKAKIVLLKDFGRFCKRGGKFAHVVENEIIEEAIELIKK